MSVAQLLPLIKKLHQMLGQIHVSCTLLYFITADFLHSCLWLDNLENLVLFCFLSDLSAEHMFRSKVLEKVLFCYLYSNAALYWHLYWKRVVGTQPHHCHTTISRVITINLCSCKFCMFSEQGLCRFFHQHQQSQREIHYKGKRQ